MPEKILGTFQIRRLVILDEEGNADEALMPPLSDDDFRRIYELFIRCRVFDQRALNLQREGRLGTYASILGQEASQIGSALVLGKTDWVFPSFREIGVLITLGYPLHMIFQYWSGDERGAMVPDHFNIFPFCVPVGTQIPHAAGAGMAIKYRKEDKVVMVFLGDGATSEGDFHEGMNFAGVFRLPVVFICQNNQWAISVPRDHQTASETLAQKAVAYGFEGIQVDGNDVFAVYRAAQEAVEKARRGDGPTFIECFTYRMSDHTTADDASRYRKKEDMEAWKQRDPLLRFILYMKKRGIWTAQFHNDAEEKAKAAVDDAVKKEESLGPPLPADMFAHTYGSLWSRQKKQMGDF